MARIGADGTLVSSGPLSTLQTALREERGLFAAASYLKSDRMLWLFWFAIDSACTPSCC